MRDSFAAKCRSCRHQVSLTAGTILASTKLPLRTWFLAMYLMTQTKNGISALELSRQLSVSYNTAWKVKHKVMQVMKERDDTRPLGGWVRLDIEAVEIDELRDPLVGLFEFAHDALPQRRRDFFHRVQPAEFDSHGLPLRQSYGSPGRRRHDRRPHSRLQRFAAGNRGRKCRSPKTV